MFQDYKVAFMRKHVKVRDTQRFSFLRTSVAYMLSHSAKRIPHAAINIDLDATPLVEYCRSEERRIAETAEEMTDEVLFQRAIRKTYSAFLLKAIAHSLYHTPCLNSFLDYNPWKQVGTIYHAEDINIGFTVHTKYGVVRPVLQNAHQKTIEEVASECRDLTRRARRTDPEELYLGAAKYYLLPSLKQLDFGSIFPGYLLLRGILFQRFKPSEEYKKIPPEQKLDVKEILGATCSVANIGMMIDGHQTVTALSCPEVMMFGLGHLHEQPMVIDGEVVARQVITLCATMDHRAFDAGEAFPFGGHIQRYMANPELIYEWKPGDDI